MIDLSFSPLQVAVVAVLNFMLSALVFSPAMPWFAAWARGVGADPSKREMSEADRKGMPILMLGAVVSSFLTAYGLDVLVRNLGISTFTGGALLGVLAWAAFVVTQLLNSRFEGRKPVVLLINAILYLATYAGFSGLLAVWS